MKTLGILDLLSLCGFDPTAKGKLVRHQDARYGSALHELGWLELYQRYKRRPVYDGCDFWTITSGFESLSVHARIEGRDRSEILQEIRAPRGSS